ncbi:MAG: glycosyltransferase family 1 protein [Muribaculaceae bacterium]
MKIGIEAQRIFRTNKHGMDFVALEVIKELQRIDHENEYFIFVAPGADRCLEPSTNVHIIEVKCPTYPLWEQIALPLAVAGIKLDILHCTSNTAPIFCSVSLILTLHDIIFLENQEGSNKSWYQNMGRIYRRIVVPKILKKCKKIITVSNFERNNIISKLHLPKHNIVTIHNGYNNRFSVLTDDVSCVTQKYIAESEYLLLFGNTDPRKNVPRTLKAYSAYLNQSNKKRHLLIIDIDENILNTIIKDENIENIRPYICSYGYIPIEDIAYLYNGAWLFLYTSLREGFGIPILESMACGTPVITGNVSSMPEVAGDGGMLVNTFDANAIANKLLEFESDESLYDIQVDYGFERVKQYSWNNTAKALLKVYKETVNS